MQFRKNISTLKVHHNKHTAGCQPIRVAPPKEVLLPMNMHSGSPAEPIVAVGDYVRVGQLIAKPGATTSTTLFNSFSSCVEYFHERNRTRRNAHCSFYNVIFWS